MKFLKSLFQVLFATTLLLLLLEGIFRVVGLPGGSSFVEGVVIREHLGRKKPKGEFRIFTYGESTMHGAHYWPVSSPVRWLAVYLKDFLPDKNVRVINFSRIGRGSDFNLETFKATLFYRPDAVIFYLGHNTFLPGNRKEEIEAKRAKLGYRIKRWSQKSYLFSTIYRWVIQKRIESTKEKSEDGMEFHSIETPPRRFNAEQDIFPRNSRSYRESIEFFKQNVHAILRLARENHVPILFLKPVCNLKDFSPSHSIHMKPLTAAELRDWDNAYQKGEEMQSRGNSDGALSYYNQAYRIDNTYAELSFLLGQIYFQKGDYEKARQFFEEARDYDAVMVRATKDTLNVIEEFRFNEGLDLMDTEKILAPEVPSGILGEPIIEDNVHFSLKGHALVGRAMAEEVAKRNWITPKGEWRFNRERSYDEIARELGITPELMLSADIKMIYYFGTRYENRIRFAQRALTIDPKNSIALRQMAWTYWLMGEKQKAVEAYERLGELYPDTFQEIMHAHPDIERDFSHSRPKALSSLS